MSIDPSAPGVALRCAEPSDVPAITALVRAAYARWIPVIGREPRPMQVDYAAAVTRHRFDLAVVDGALAGLVETTLRPDHLWIENLAVAPERQGRGLGRLLLAHAERLAQEAGRPACRLLTNGAFVANVDLYTAVGFTVDRREPFLDGWTVYMSRPVRRLI